MLLVVLLASLSFGHLRDFLHLSPQQLSPSSLSSAPLVRCCDLSSRPRLPFDDGGFVCCPSSGQWQPATAPCPGSNTTTSSSSSTLFCCALHVCPGNQTAVWDRAAASCGCVAASRPGTCPQVSSNGLVSVNAANCENDFDCAVSEKCCGRKCMQSCEPRTCEAESLLPCKSKPEIVLDSRGCPVGCDQSCCVHGESLELENTGGVRCVCVGGSWKCKVKSRNKSSSCTPGDLLYPLEQESAARQSCVCSNQGKWSCQKSASLVKMECKPGESRQDGACNTCVCSKRGVWKCTDLTCARDCQPGETKTQDGCRRCACNQNGKWECERRRCGPPRSGNCIPGTVFEQDDKRWTCATDGSTWRLDTKGRTSDKPECSPSDSKTAGCQPCRCEGGKWSCPDSSACLPGPVCEEGTRKKMLCNDCRCKNGGWDCSKRTCALPTICVEGARRPGGDMCNFETCIDNTWVSSNMTCSGVCISGDLKHFGCHNCMCVNSRWRCGSGPCPACWNYECPLGTKPKYFPERRCVNGVPCRPCKCE